MVRTVVAGERLYGIIGIDEIFKSLELALWPDAGLFSGLFDIFGSNCRRRRAPVIS